MSASMAEVLALHGALSDCRPDDEHGYCAAPDCWWYYEANGDLPELIAAHQAEVLAANGYGKLPEPTWNPDKALVGPKKCNGCKNEIKGGSRHGFCSDCLGDEW